MTTPTSIKTVAYLGPEGSFSSLLARQRFIGYELVPRNNVRDIVRYVETHEDSLGVVPIENSSGGIVHDTVDEFVKDNFQLYILEELGIHVRLAFFGPRPGESIKTIYSHWVPLKHCEAWLEKTYPEANPVAVRSTSEAAQIAAQDTHAAAISTKEAGEKYGLTPLFYPIEEDIENATQFFTIGRERATGSDHVETSMVVTLRDGPGTLYHYLKPFNEHDVNLKRITSRNVPGSRSLCKFFIGIEGSEAGERVSRALKAAGGIAANTRILGSYPRRTELYQS